MGTKTEMQELQTKYVINYLIKDKGCTLGEASKIWYNSRTKKVLQDTEVDYTFVAPTRCYDELLMELNNDPHWMKGQFD